jgi:antitoxin VapB
MLNIKRPETYELAKRLAAHTGESLTDAVTKAIEERLARLEDVRRTNIEERLAKVREITRSYREAIGEPRPTLEELDQEMYDEDGLPR